MNFTETYENPKRAGGPRAGRRWTSGPLFKAVRQRRGLTLLGSGGEERLHVLRDFFAVTFGTANLFLFVLADPHDQAEFPATFFAVVFVSRHKGSRRLFVYPGAGV